MHRMGIEPMFEEWKSTVVPTRPTTLYEFFGNYFGQFLCFLKF